VRYPKDYVVLTTDTVFQGLTFDEMLKRWGWTRSASPRHSAAWCVDPLLASFRLPTPLFQAKFTPEELNFVGILDDGADSPFVLSLQGPLGEH
jgi:hypothetical protein